jgi:hypothetical protein
LTLCPSTASIAGSNVSEANTETAGINMPPRPTPRSNGNGRTIIDRSPTATVPPETITEWPAWVIVSTSADSTSFPSRSSSR